MSYTVILGLYGGINTVIVGPYDRICALQLQTNVIHEIVTMVTVIESRKDTEQIYAYIYMLQTPLV